LALDGKTYALMPGQMVIADDHGPESLAGIMGGEASGCTPETEDVFLESAWWDPITIAATGRALKINSDARYRFERGVDPAFTLPGLELATQMILDLCGGEAGTVVQDGAPVDTARSYQLDPARLVGLVGMDIPEATQRATLEALGFTLDGNAVTPPSWRPDILGDADLVEEVARIASLTKLQGAPMARQLPGVPKPILTPLQVRERSARRTLAALGYNEAVTYSFIDAKAAALFGGGTDAVRVENPISSEMSHLAPRPSARPPRGGGAEPGARVHGPGALRGRPGLPRRRARGPAPAGGGPTGRRCSPA
jgi:phenylalanyl-tRNA synthetase beta chain